MGNTSQVGNAEVDNAEADNAGQVSSWYNKDQLDELGEVIQEGDLLEFDRTTYKHWAVCVEVAKGDIRIVHHVSDLSVGEFVKGSGTATKADHAGITMESIRGVLGSDKVRINNSKDEKLTRRSRKDVVKFAKDAVGSKAIGTYNLLTNNCEHFASLCRYDKKVSYQADTGMPGVAGKALQISASR